MAGGCLGTSPISPAHGDVCISWKRKQNVGKHMTLENRRIYSCSNKSCTEVGFRVGQMGLNIFAAVRHTLRPFGHICQNATWGYLSHETRIVELAFRLRPQSCTATTGLMRRWRSITETKVSRIGFQHCPKAQLKPIETVRHNDTFHNQSPCTVSMMVS